MQNEIEDKMQLTPVAKKLWEKIPPHIRVKLLNNVWCGSCVDSVGIGNTKGFVERGDLILEGVCTKCGHSVCRVIESE